MISPIGSYKVPLLSSLLLLGSCGVFGQNNTNNNLERSPKQDIVCISNTNKCANETNMQLEKAPSCKVMIQGKKRNAKIVVELSTNKLYKYDENGNAIAVYPIASGKPSTPTDTGIRIVSHIETYPYKTAPKHTKRRRNPIAYGPKIICLDILNPKTGQKSPIGEFIHGNNDPTSIGKYASMGCMRMHNETVKELSKEVKRGDIVIIQRSE